MPSTHPNCPRRPKCQQPAAPRTSPSPTSTNVVLIDGPPNALLVASNDPAVTEAILDLLRTRFGYEPEVP